MTPRLGPRAPVYIISKGRHASNQTAMFLREDGVPFTVVVEPQEYDAYRAALPDATIAVLPFSNLGLGSIPARNWVWEHARSLGVSHHWILDDNILAVRRYHRGVRIKCDAGPAFAVVEDFVDRYENVAIAGLNYSFFVRNGSGNIPPFHLNSRVYSCLYIRNDLPMRWRGRYNEDTDLCLQVLAAGWCTVSVNAFVIDKMRTMTMKGGNSDELYQGDGRLEMARSLERAWPGIVTTRRRFGRPQHVIKDNWNCFKTPLKLKPGIDRAALAAGGPNEYGLTLRGDPTTTRTKRGTNDAKRR